MLKFTDLGMMLQAFATSTGIIFKLFNVTFAQQFVAGIIYLIVFLVITILEKKKNEFN